MPLKLISLGAISLIVVACLLYFAGVVDHSVMNWLVLIGTVVWFVASPLWMLKKSKPAASIE